MIKLNRYILKTNYGVSYGSATLKSLQNDNIPELDLLVRESIQNSSDAAISIPGDSFAVDFNTGTFIPARFNSLLTGIDNYLNTKYSASRALFLEIRDTGTSGLNGCTRKNEIKTDDHGNYFRLIFDSGKQQTKKQAGGNWGFGKSVYYRVGIGIVIYYSQIQTEVGGKESRLIITLIEDEGKKNPDNTNGTILGTIEPQSAGKAWWGIRDQNDLLPIVDEQSIKEILDIFELKPFEKNETGTSIIIPYVDSNKLCGDIIPADSEIRYDVKNVFKHTWCSSISSYLNLSIQKWYAPKIHNLFLKQLGKKWLKVRVNGLAITVNNKINPERDMLPFFKLVQELYNTALAKALNENYSSTKFQDIVCQPINIRNYFDGTTTGFLSIIRVNSSELNGEENSLSPYDYIGHFEADGGLNDPVVMFTREPGMVIDYPITGPWVKGIDPPDDPECFLFAFYVPITDKKLRDNLEIKEYAGMEFGEYLRKCEASDHMGWEDPAKMQLVSKIQKNCVNSIKKHATTDTEQTIEATASKLANKLGRRLLPRIGYGKKQIGGGSGGEGGSAGGRIKDAVLDFTDQRMFGNRTEMDFSLRFMHQKKKAEIALLIASEGGSWIAPRSWVDEIGTAFPVTIESIKISTIAFGEDAPISVNGWECSSLHPSTGTEIASVSMIKGDDSETYTSLCIETDDNNLRITGTVSLYAADKKYQFAVKID